MVAKKRKTKPAKRVSSRGKLIKKPLKLKRKKSGKKVGTTILPPNVKEQIAQEPVFGKKHPQCNEVAHFYSLPGQLNLVLHGVPFRLIRDQFVRFHAVHSTVIGWKFTIIYTVILFSTIANSVLFRSSYLDLILWIFILSAATHAIINLYMAQKTRNCEEVSLPIVTDVARRISE